MNRNVRIALIIAVLAAGGYWYFSGVQADRELAVSIDAVSDQTHFDAAALLRVINKTETSQDAKMLAIQAVSNAGNDPKLQEQAILQVRTLLATQNSSNP